MTEQQKKEIRLKIEKLIEDSLADIEVLEQATAPISPENSIGRVSRMDAINNKSVAEAALRNKRQKLGKLKMALSNIDKPNFGMCDMCKRSINPARLIFMPESTRCMRCADRK